MRAIVAAVSVCLFLVAVPSAMAEVIDADGFAAAGGLNWTWSATYDTALNDLTFQCDLVDAVTGQPASPTAGMIATVTVVQANGQDRTLDCVPLMNIGPQFDGNVNLKVATTGRWSGFFVRTSFRP